MSQALLAYDLTSYAPSGDPAPYIPGEQKLVLKPALVFVVALCAANQSFAQAQLSTGDTMPTLTLKDQHDKPVDIPPDARRLLFVADNGGTALATQLVESQEPDWLTRTKQVFVADIHKMPGLVARLIAIPQLKEKPYQILLGREAAELQIFPRKKDCVTVITSKDGKVGDITFACSREELQAASSL